MAKFKIILFSVVLLTTQICFAYAKTETFSGKIYEVYASDDQFTVSSFRASDGVTSMMQFKVGPETEYSGIVNLGDLHLDQLVDIEFKQDEQGFFVAKKISVMTQEKEGETV